MPESKVTLYRHQVDAAAKAIENGGNFAIFHEPGLGKTCTTLEVYTYLRQKTPNLKLLVLCPISLINSAWGEDVAKFTTYRMAPFVKLPRTWITDIDIIVINYEKFITMKSYKEIMRMAVAVPFMCVLDESSRLKNHKSITTKMLIQCQHFFKHRIILSGTPMPNSEMELWAQMRFVRPEIMEKSFHHFKNTFFHLERNGQPLAVVHGQSMTRDMMRSIMQKGFKYAITPAKRALLMDRIRPFVDWRKKEDALDLPEKIDQVREVSLSQDERRAYLQMKKHLVAEINGHDIAAAVMLAKVMKLRQATSGFMYDENGTAHQVGRSKINELMDVLEELGEQQVLILANFHYEIDSIVKEISEKYGAETVATLYSETDDRDVSINGFKHDNVRYLVAHPKSAAHGLTFVNCRTTVFFSLDYSYESHEQARNRTHRIGQVNKCLYVYLLATDTIDKDLRDVLRKKGDIQEVVYRIINQ